MVCLRVVVRESCYPLLRTLLHGAFPWLQPRSPVDRKVAERGRGPDPPDARVEARASVRAESALLAHGNRAEENRRVAAAAGNLPAARAAEERLAEERAADGKAEAAVAALAVDGSLPWLA